MAEKNKKINLEVLTTGDLDTELPFCVVVGEGKALICFAEFALTESNGKVVLRLFSDKRRKKQTAIFRGIGEDFALTVFGNKYAGICEQCGGDLFD